MKNIVKLSESQLHNMISESVKNVISEVDWKTYANAAKKSKERADQYRKDSKENQDSAYWKSLGERMRAHKFSDAAKERFNSDFGYKKATDVDADYAEVALDGDFDNTELYQGQHAVGYKPMAYGKGRKKKVYIRPNLDGVNTAKEEYHQSVKDMSPEDFFDGNSDAADAWEKANSEIRNYKNGKYAYDDEKGWHIKESKLDKIVSESVKKILTETELSYDLDNFSGRWSRGNRYDILVDDEPYYNDIPEESVDKLVNQLEKQGYENIKVVDLNDDDSEPKNIKNWYDESEETYDVAAMIKSDMNPLSHTFKAPSIQDALKQAMKYFTGFTSKGEKDVDIYYVKHHGYDEI